MLLPVTHYAPTFGHHFPLIDTEFDRFEINIELEGTLREAAIANFYHDLLNSED